MGKRVIIVVLAILVSGLVILGFLLRKERQLLLTDPYKAISPGACIIVETADIKSFLNSLTSGKGLVGEAGKVPEWKNFTVRLQFLTNQINKAEYQKLLNDAPAVIALHQSEEKTLLLLAVSIPADAKFKDLKNIIDNSGFKNIIDNNGENPLIKIPYKIGTRSDTVFVSLHSGLLFCSNSHSLIDLAHDQSEKSTDVRDLKGFSRVYLASGKNEDKIFVVFANLQKLINSAFRENGDLLADKVSKLAGSSGGDIYISEEGIVLSGYTETTDTSEFLNKFIDLPSRTFQTYKILPSSTVLLETTILPDRPQINIISTDTIEKAIAKIQSLTGDEISKAIIDLKGNLPENNTIYIYELTNRHEAELAFHEGFAGISETLYFTPDEQTSIPVYKTSASALRKLNSNYSGTSDELFFTFYDIFLISGNSYKTVTRLLYDNLLSRTLANDLEYRDFEGTLPSQGCYFFYCDPSGIADYLEPFLDEDLIQAIKANQSSLNKLSAAGWSFSSRNGMIYNSLSVRFREKAGEESSTEWQTLLDTVSVIKPFFFTNHLTGSREIFVQDLKNNIYLINSAGRILWKVSLNERISGSVNMIDYYKNGKFQLLFAGHNYIHLIDRNGNYVERFPVKLRSPATNPPALFDYDNNLDYRFFIAGEDNIVYSYEKSGNTVKGWTPFKTFGPVHDEIQHFRISGKDFIVVTDPSDIHFLDRTGKERLKIKEPLKKAPGSALRLKPGSRPSLVCSSPSGEIQHIYFDGTVKRDKLKEFSGLHRFDYFDINADGFGEYIFIDNDMMYLYDHNLIEIFSRKFDSKNLYEPTEFIFSATDRKIGIFDNANKLIYLIEKNGENMNGFPLRGASMFSIGKLVDKSGWNLIVGGTDRFLYNYKLETQEKSH